MARRFRERVIRPAPRTKIWVGQRLSVIQPAGGAATLLGVMNAAFLLLRPFTILRTRLEINFRSDQTAAGETPNAAYGHIVVKETATTIGITAVPTPQTEEDADWFIYQGMICSVVSLTSVGYDGNQGVRYSIDSKAMRKVGPQDDVASVIELDAAAGALINVEGRQLIQLH